MIRSNAPTNRKARRERQRQKAAYERRLARYGEALLAKGMEDREVARAVYYVARYGFEALDVASGGGRGCVEFDEPNCGDWDCVNPEHQRLKVMEG